MFFNFFLKSFRILLLPFALVYWLVIRIRNLFFDRKIFSSTEYGLPLICVGNLSVGGTGKSPMVEYLVALLKDEFKVATLSRGYKRKTKGYALARTDTTALEIGDEPMQFHLKFPEVPVAVGEQRVEAIPQLLHDEPATQAVILDDAFQHRAVKAGLNILLTDYNNLFTRDFYLPTGDLRDLKSSYRRAEIIVVTKCKPDLSEKEQNQIISEINPAAGQQIFFTAIEYGELYQLFSQEKVTLDKNTEVLLVTGIANPRPLKKKLEEQVEVYHMLAFPDHHIFSMDDLNEIRSKFEAMDSTQKMILTTEKDAVRLLKFKTEMENWPVYVIPVKHRFLGAGSAAFDLTVKNFIRHFKKPAGQ